MASPPRAAAGTRASQPIPLPGPNAQGKLGPEPRGTALKIELGGAKLRRSLERRASLADAEREEDGECVNGAVTCLGSVYEETGRRVYSALGKGGSR